ncbi:TetR/AcrR family transcriptional regulator [Streptacidiphilus sp. P02-A3a]|uniref:TetR/AcrR family transcriptional regulator n=1 Tax=Streptacidiphilus sp. P02-A3a TaxID=2704468 RepID=UPI0015FE6605|nr:TetR/AcrR family transcriptional regulator [Streptacidiphilus sp. P02-A3a]QMU70823.1 TetR/AcrR family transcriptional regulator [Streptacidiphilus sp. P02-A3a]
MTGLPIGRPRSDAARRAVLDAAMALAVRDGYTAVTIKGIAQTAGVGRQTVYRWWPTRGAVMMEALAEVGAAHGLPEPTADPWADLRTFLDSTFALAGTRPVVGVVLLGVTADAVADPELSALRRGYIAGRRAMLRGLLERCGRQWQVPVDTIVDMVFGAMWYRLMNEHSRVGPELTVEMLTAIELLSKTAGVREPGALRSSQSKKDSN